MAVIRVPICGGSYSSTDPYESNCNSGKLPQDYQYLEV